MDFSFKSYLIEVLDVEDQPIDKVELKDQGGGFLYHSFDVLGEEYTIKFKPLKYGMELTTGEFMHAHSETIHPERGYDITLTGPTLVSLTGRNVPFDVYGKVLLAVKALLLRYKPQWLHFYGAQSDQDIMYSKFFQRFLRPAEGKPDYLTFHQVTLLDYISEEYIKSCSPRIQEMIEEAIEFTSKQKQQQLQAATSNKKMRRANIVDSFRTAGPIAKAAIGRVLLLSQYRLIVITRTDTQNLYFMMFRYPEFSTGSERRISLEAIAASVDNPITSQNDPVRSEIAKSYRIEPYDIEDINWQDLSKDYLSRVLSVLQQRQSLVDRSIIENLTRIVGPVMKDARADDQRQQ